jgi:protein-tyrosine phosphatase
MLSAVDSPVVAPSANLAGEPSPRSADEVLGTLEGKIDLLIDSGPTQYGIDSTIVAIDDAGWRIVRKGVYDQRTIKKFLRRKFLFVCTGNTCRSPLAAGLAKKLLADRLGCGRGGTGPHGH